MSNRQGLATGHGHSPTHRRRWLAVLATAVVAAATITACGSGGGSGSTVGTDGRKLINVDVAEGGYVAWRLPFYVAYYGGYFEKYGIKVSLEHVETGTAADQLLSGGRVQFETAPFANVLNQHLGGTDAVALGLMANHQTNAIVISEKHKSTYKSLSDLADMTIGVTAIGSSQWQFVKYLQKLANIPDSRLKIVAYSGNANAVAKQDLQSGRLDAMALADPVASQMVREGVGFWGADFQDPKDSVAGNSPQFVAQADEPFVGYTIISTKSYVNANPKVAQAFVSGIADANVYIRTHTAEDVATILAKNPGFKNQQIQDLVATVQRMTSNSSLPASLAIPEQNFTNARGYSGQVTPKALQVTYADVVDNTYANAANVPLSASSARHPAPLSK